MSIYPEWRAMCKRAIKSEEDQMKKMQIIIDEYRPLLVSNQMDEGLQHVVKQHAYVIDRLQHHIEIIDSGDKEAVDADAWQVSEILFGGMSNER